MNALLDTIGYLFSDTDEQELADMDILPSPIVGLALVLLFTSCGIAAMGGPL